MTRSSVSILVIFILHCNKINILKVLNRSVLLGKRLGSVGSGRKYKAEWCAGGCCQSGLHACMEIPLWNLMFCKIDTNKNLFKSPDLPFKWPIQSVNTYFRIKNITTQSCFTSSLLNGRTSVLNFVNTNLEVIVDIKDHSQQIQMDKKYLFAIHNVFR